jgi:hypothetical protein
MHKVSKNFTQLGGPGYAGPFPNCKKYLQKRGAQVSRSGVEGYGERGQSGIITYSLTAYFAVVDKKQERGC